jgi:hypothetical protein
MTRVSRGLWVVMSLLGVASSGCDLGPQVLGSGKLVQEERQLSGFVALEVENHIEATVVVDPNQPPRVRLVGDDNLVALMRAEVEGARTLHVYLPKEEVGSWQSRNPLRVEVTVPRLESLSRSGGGTVDVSGRIAERINLTARGGGIVKVRGLDASSITLDVSGGGDVTVEGRASYVKSIMSGGGTLRARELSVEYAQLSSFDGGSTEMRVSSSLYVTAGGGGAVRIIGRPAVLQEDLSGGSTLVFE